MPIVKVDGKTLGVFAEESPKFGVGTKFEASIQKKSNSAVFLHIEQNSIHPPEIAQGSPQDSQSKVQPEKSLTEKMMDILKQRYTDARDRDKPVPVTIGELKGSISPDGETTLRTKERKPVFKGNILTGNVHQDQLALVTQNNNPIKPCLSTQNVVSKASGIELD